jgi:hypothetical protein
MAACLCQVSYAWAQPRGSNRVTVSPLQRLVITRGATATEAVQVVVENGSHVNSDKPRSEFLIPFRLDWESGPVSAGSVTYPSAEEIQVGPDKLVVFTGSFPVRTVFHASPMAPVGNLQLKGKLHYQACNSQMCFRPASIELLLPVTVQ